MKDFGRWFSDFSPPKQEVAEEDVMLPDGVDEMNDGTFTARCCYCGERREILCDISEIPMQAMNTIAEAVRIAVRS